MATPTLWGSNFKVNSSLSNTQQQQHVGSLANGRMVEAWLDYGSSITTIKMRLLNVDGTAATPEAVVNTGQTTSGQMGFGQASADYLAVTGLKGGGFVVTWSYQHAGTSNEDVYFKVFTSAGVAVTGNVAVSGNTLSGEDDVDIVATADGGFAIAWDSTATNADGVWVEKFSAAGVSQGPAVRHTGRGALDPALAADSAGNLVLGYRDDLHASNRDGVYGYSETGGTEFQLDSGRDWNGTNTTFNTRPDVAVLGNGDVVGVYWDWGVNATHVDNVFMSINGGAAVQVNTSAISGGTDPSVVALPDGGFLVVWNDGGSDAVGGTDHDVVAQLFNSDGTKNGGELVLTSSAITNNNLNTVEAVSLGDGRVLVSWEAGGPQTQGPDIFSQIIDTRTAGVNITGTSAARQYAGTKFADTITGGSGSEMIAGYSGTDTLRGNSGNDILKGGSSNDIIIGGLGSDTIIGGLGADRTAGGAGVDRFRFDSRSEAGDVITDFGSADYIVLEGSAFGLGSYSGVLQAARLDVGGNSVAANTAQRLIFNTITDQLWYDSNGSGAGGTRVMIADLVPNFTLAATDILIV